MDIVSAPSGPSGNSQEQVIPEFGFRPLTTGQILDRSFALYRSHFALFAGFAVFPAAISLLFGLAQVAYLLLTHQPIVQSAASANAHRTYVTLGLSLASAVARICVYGISIAATTWCIASIYQGHAATMRNGFDFALRKWLRYVLLVLAQAWSVMWLPSVVAAALMTSVFFIPGLGRSKGGFVGAVIFVALAGALLWVILRFLRVSLAIPACVVEDLSITAAIRRSKALLVSRKIRIFLLFLFLIVLEMVFFALLIPVSAFAVRSGPTGHLVLQMTSLVIAFAYGVLVSPIAAVALSLFYFDERVRREGFDIEFLLRKSTADFTAPPLEPSPES